MQNQANINYTNNLPQGPIMMVDQNGQPIMMVPVMPAQNQNQFFNQYPIQGDVPPPQYINPIMLHQNSQPLQMYQQPILLPVNSQYSQPPQLSNKQSSIQQPLQASLPLLSIQTMNQQSQNTNFTSQRDSRLLELQQQMMKIEKQILSQIDYLKSCWTVTEVGKKYKFFFGFKILMQFYFLLYLIVSCAVYYQRPKYEYREDADGTVHFQAMGATPTNTGYECTTIQSEDVLSLINKTTAYVTIALILIIPYKIMFIIKQFKIFRKVYKRGFVTKAQKFNTSYLDYINVFFDYTFVIILSPLTAVVYEDCPNLRYGIYTFNPSLVYGGGVVFAIFNFVCLLILLQFCKNKNFNLIMVYPVLIMVALPGTLIVILMSIGVAVLASPTTEYITTTYYSDGSSTETKSDDACVKGCIGLTFIGLALFVLAYFVIILCISFALLLVYCHPAVILYYTSSFVMAIISVCLNRRGLDYLAQLQAMYALQNVKDTPQFKAQFSQLTFDFTQYQQQPKFISYQQEAKAFENNPTLAQLNARSTISKINSYEPFVEGIVAEYQMELIQKEKKEPEINQATILPTTQTQT